MNKPKLEVILRTCARANVMTGSWQRYVSFDKKQLVLGCAQTLFHSLQLAKSIAQINVLILDDGSDADSVEKLLGIAKNMQISAKLQQLGGVGFNQSALKQFELSKSSTADWVYCVEDDYLHDTSAIKIMLEDAVEFEKKLGGQLIALHPFDDPFTYYHLDKMSSSKVVLGSDRHWRTNTFSTNTIFSKPFIFSEFWPTFEKLANEYGINSTTEHNTINLLWNNGVDRHGPVYLLTPIPSLALHLSYNNESPFINWKQWWPQEESLNGNLRDDCEGITISQLKN